MTNEGLTHLSLSELHTCHNYFQRLFYAVLELSDLAASNPYRSWSSTFSHQAKVQLQKKWLNQSNENGEIDQCIETISLSEAKDFTRNYFKTIEGLLTLKAYQREALPKLMAETLNLLFLHARRLHILIAEDSQLEIDLPRVTLMDTIPSDDSIPAFRVNEELIFDQEDENLPIRSIEAQRDKKYDELIQTGHKWVSQKENLLARESFFRALNFKETAEAYNLIAWTYSLDENIEIAKKFCMKAIHTDPAYGAPYNDLGSYLLAEGEVNESLKWFELAKNSRNYQNREYPYINTGRALMTQRKYKEALNEFSMALTIAPYNEELHTTVQRLKETLEKSSLFRKKPEETPPPLF